MDGRADIDAAITSYLRRLAAAIAADAKAACPVDTGELRESIDHEVHGHVARIGSNVEHAAIVELGSAPHTIRVRNAQVLANRETGDVFGPVVHHPGTRAQPYLRPALTRHRGGL